jgi:large subunit ribosomal protein L10
MKRIGLLTREKIIEEIKKRAENTHACIFVTFSKVNALSFSLLRNNLRKIGANIFVAKNSLFRRVFENLGYQNLNGLLEGETGVVFVHDKDIVKVCKVIIDFTKENENFKLKGGFLKKEKVDAEQFNSLAKLPSQEVLMGMAVGAIASPLTGFLTVMNHIILKFLWVVEEIKKKKE